VQGPRAEPQRRGRGRSADEQAHREVGIATARAALAVAFEEGPAEDGGQPLPQRALDREPVEVAAALEARHHVEEGRRWQRSQLRDLADAVGERQPREAARQLAGDQGAALALRSGIEQQFESIVDIHEDLEVGYRCSRPALG
jgi:hypothetical protein